MSYPNKGIKSQKINLKKKTVALTFAETHAWLWLEVKTTMEWNSNMDDANTTSVDMHVSRAGSMHET